MAVKKLIEVALPLDAINAASAREKSIRHGHPSTLHLWWARRPLAAARAVIWSSLVDDPSSHPEEFPTEEEQTAERERLFRILEELVVWENSNDQRVLDAAKAEIRKSMGDEPPAFLDPFAGGGAIPLEAQRLGLKSHAHDLNPVAVTINKAMIEIPPRFFGNAPVNPDSRKLIGIDNWDKATGLAADIEYYGNFLKEIAFERVGDLYPRVGVDGNHETAVAWLWARTVKCPNPACGCETPLIRSFDLCKKKGKEFHLTAESDHGELRFAVKKGKSSQSGTVSRKGAVCIKCGEPIAFDYIREEGKQRRISYKLMASVGEAAKGKDYFPATREDVDAATTGRPDVDFGDLAFYPGYINPVAYGYTSIDSLFTDRQLTTLCCFSDALDTVQARVHNDAIAAGMNTDSTRLAEGGDGAFAYAEAVRLYLSFVIDKVADYNSSLCSWHNSGEKIGHTFGMAGMPMSWDFVEANPFSHSSGSYGNMLEWVIRAFNIFPGTSEAFAEQRNAQDDPKIDNLMVSTDPPYYSNVPYADFADFFYVWLRRSLNTVYPELYRTMLTPKSEELVADPYRENRGQQGARNFFEEGMYNTFKQIASRVRADVPLTVYYAFKQTEKETINDVESSASTGWETMLTALIRAGFAITGTWPMRTEMPNRARGRSSNALASSIVLVCRKRPTDAPMATRREFVNTLKRELKPALDKLQTSNIAPVDMAQSAIGPGIGVYSRFSKVLEADGSEMTVRSALQIINQELDLYFSDQDSDLDRESRFCVDLYTQCAFNEIKFGEADVLARAKNTSIEGLAEKGALFASKGIVRLLGRDELKGRIDNSFTWLFTQQLAHAMETGGIEACAKLVKDVFDSRAENAKALAYRLFTIADKKGWNAEAFAYNSLVVAWPEIQAKAAQLQAEEPVQYTLNFDSEEL